MKKLTLKELNLEGGEILSRDELKDILSDSLYAGAGSGSGSGSRRGSGSGSGSRRGSGSGSGSRRGSGSGSRRGSGSGSTPCVKSSPIPKIYACECQPLYSYCVWVDAQGMPHEGTCQPIMFSIHCSNLL